MNLCIKSVLLSTLLLCLTSTSNAEAPRSLGLVCDESHSIEVKEILLSRCYVDSPFDRLRIEHEFGRGHFSPFAGSDWYDYKLKSTYPHVMTTHEKYLIIVSDCFGQTTQREIEKVIPEFKTFAEAAFYKVNDLPDEETRNKQGENTISRVVHQYLIRQQPVQCRGN